MEVVLIGSQMADRRWVRYEMIKAWNEKRPIVGISIHGLADRDGRTDRAGANPFSQVPLRNGGTVADYVPVRTPTGMTSQAVYRNVQANLRSWVEGAYRRS